MKNTNLIEKYLCSGCKGVQTEAVGIELEHFVVKKDTGESAPFYGESGVGELIEQISGNFDKKIYSENILIAVSNTEYSVTLEPSSQLEISIMPTKSIAEAEKIYNGFVKMITPYLEKSGLKLITEGYRPRGRASDLELIPKKRYEYMNAYFEKTGDLGKNMMRATASTQVSVDFSDEADCERKFRVANILSPLFALICDNSKYFEDEVYSGRMARAYVWENVDGDRCGVVPFGEKFTFLDYANYIYNKPAILVFENGKAVFTDNKPISDIYKDKQLTDEEIEHLLSMFFPDVRLKRYIEIRPADSMEIEYVLSYAALIKGIFADCTVFDFKAVTSNDVKKAKKEVIENGFDAYIYGKKAYEICDMMIDCAKNALDIEEVKYLAPMERIIKTRKTLKEIV